MDDELREAITEILWNRVDLYEWYVDVILEEDEDDE